MADYSEAVGEIADDNNSCCNNKNDELTITKLQSTACAICGTVTAYFACVRYCSSFCLLPGLRRH